MRCYYIKLKTQLNGTLKCYRDNVKYYMFMPADVRTFGIPDVPPHLLFVFSDEIISNSWSPKLYCRVSSPGEDSVGWLVFLRTRLVQLPPEVLGGTVFVSCDCG